MERAQNEAGPCPEPPPQPVRLLQCQEIDNHRPARRTRDTPSPTPLLARSHHVHNAHRLSAPCPRLRHASAIMSHHQEPGYPETCPDSPAQSSSLAILCRMLPPPSRLCASATI